MREIRAVQVINSTVLNDGSVSIALEVLDSMHYCHCGFASRHHSPHAPNRSERWPKELLDGITGAKAKAPRALHGIQSGVRW